MLLVFISGSRGFLLAQRQVLEQPVGALVSPLFTRSPCDTWSHLPDELLD
jgi:hypothetical protein